MIRFLAGFVAAGVVAGLCGLAAVWFGLVPARADSPKPFAIEKWAAKRSLRATIRREMPQPPYPFAASDAALVAGAKLYMTNCSVCHGSGVGDASNVARGQYVEVPQFAKEGVDDDPAGQTYWMIEHGARFTGMPAYVGLLSEEQIWDIAFFLGRATEKLPPAAAAIWNQPHPD